MGIEGPISRQEFEELLARVERLLHKVEDAASTLVDRVNWAIRFLPAGTGRHAVTLTDAFTVDLGTFFALIKPLMLSPGWPPALYTTGDDWTNKVGDTVSRLGDLASIEQTRVDEHWQGTAASAYTQTLVGTGKALKAIKGAADEIDDALFKMCAALVVCWVAVAVALVSYVAELIAAGAVAATVVGAPPAAGAAGISTVKVVAIVSASVTALVTLAVAVATQYKDLNQRLRNNDGLPKGEWPQLMADDMRDGSMSDRDGSDWQLRYS